MKRQPHYRAIIMVAIFFLTAFAKDLKAQHSITFFANISDTAPSEWLGHVWVGFCDGQTKRILGFYPEGLVEDSNRLFDVKYTFKVTEAQYQKALKAIAEFDSATYLIGKKDCRRFAQTVADYMGLKVPSIGLKSPAEWLGALVDNN